MKKYSYKITYEPKVSIIIPVYNVEKYLPKCLDSVINQTLKDIEIICINDESPDNCGKILAEYAKQDSRIIVLNEKNSGQGSARNRGLEIAKGKYIQFLDSDDYYEPNCCEEMYNLMEKHSDVDVACFDTNIIYEAYEDKKESDMNYFKMRYKGKTKIRPHMAHQLIDVNCWNKIFRKTFIDKNNLRFPEKLHYEDVGFFWFWITRTQYVYFYPKKLTNYVRRKGSFLGEIYEKSSKTIFDAFKVNELIYDDLVKNNKWEEFKNIYIHSYVLKFKWLIGCFSKERWKDKKKLVDSCAAFLKTFDIHNFSLDDAEEQCFDNIINKKYYMFDAYNTFEVEHILPIFEKSVNIVFSTDRNYIPYLSVSLQSIIDNSSLENNYDIVILCQDIYDFQKRNLIHQVKKYTNISIRFFNMNSYVSKYNVDRLFTRPDMSVSAYYRLFVGDIFSKYDKIIYLDCDLIVNRDIKELFGVETKDHALAACLDTNIAHKMVASQNNEKYMAKFREYMRDTFGFYDTKNYFNSGVLVIDINKFQEVNLEYLLELAQKNTEFYHDQNVLNIAFNYNCLILPDTWNVQAHIKYYPKYRQQLPINIIALYDEYEQIPAIIHYTSQPKVWHDPYKQWANIWWEYARKTPFYEILLKDLCKNGTTPPTSNSSADVKLFKDMVNYNYDKWLYRKYKILSKITFGKTRKKYRQLKKEIKWHLKKVDSMMNKVICN